MRKSSAGLSLTAKALAFAVLAAFSLTTTVAEAKPRKKAQVERSKERSKSRVKQVATPQNTDDASRWRYGSSAIIVDANTGKTLYEDNADALRHPASVTKIMTLYLLFEQLEAGNLKLDSNLEVSAKAASQQPSKLGVRPGSTIEVEDAIKALVTRSANDVAVVIAENLGGSESEFAEMMTRKARALGMSRTVFRNASGLPNPNQVTTARDLSILGRAVQDRFPKQYKYFSTRTFYYRGQAIGNHNRLLGRIEGVDGIKTGYTQASGFNLVTSVKRDGRYLVGVVLGGSSGGSRDARMTNLIAQNIDVAYAGGRTAPKVTEVAEAAIPVGRSFAAPLPVVAQRDEDTPHAVAPLPKPAAVQLAAAEPATTASISPAGRQSQQAAAQPVKPGSAEPIRPVAVKTVAVQRPAQAAAAAAPSPASFAAPAGVLGYLGPSSATLSPAASAVQAVAQGHSRQASAQTASTQTASLQAAPAPQPQQAAAPTGKDTSRLTSAVASGASEQALRAARIAAMEPDDAYANAMKAAQRPQSVPQTAPQAPGPAAARPVRTASLGPVAAPEPAANSATAKSAPAKSPVPASAHSGWQIQIGAFGGEREAKAKLDAAKARAKSVLGNADPYTEKVTKGSSELYRARFAGLDEKGARDACRLLKRNDFDCMTFKN
ncbi:D-alanyl-D-alanine carboxypeptidase family protein [Xanthobacter autotrophicus]|uniref:D-alanyl-D-alanine carboxypeptidase family protein n=1 Tax=Xanthobacter autotrophicus TaxID=280 RepID=UPI0024A6F080|nr:D-alanyl-D-alanine carboxypeptidase family protein [Xanthobacter autotrophicus]MDI4656299.1 D-alanyl-D-alanine carboxypeptidase [Xanthobacter autotrophicus]